MLQKPQQFSYILYLFCLCLKQIMTQQNVSPTANSYLSRFILLLKSSFPKYISILFQHRNFRFANLVINEIALLFCSTILLNFIFCCLKFSWCSNSKLMSYKGSCFIFKFGMNECKLKFLISVSRRMFILGNMISLVFSEGKWPYP